MRLCVKHEGAMSMCGYISWIGWMRWIENARETQDSFDMSKI